jgi:pimeloyl-ACP methyl ester carboxylesterase
MSFGTELPIAGLLLNLSLLYCLLEFMSGVLTIQSHPCFLTPAQLCPTAPLFIFLPGMDGSGKLLRTQTAGLEAEFDIRCLAIPVDDLSSWEILTEQVVELIQAERQQGALGRPVYLCGESFGGCLALRVASYAPDVLTHLLLVNPASSFRRREWMLWGGQVIRYFPEFLYELSSIALLPSLAALERIAPRDRQALLDAIRCVPQKTSAWRLSLLQTFNVDQLPLEQVTQPTLIIASAADRLLPSVTEAQTLQQRLPQSQLQVLPQSGHTCLLEADINLYQLMQQQHFLCDRDVYANLTS